MYIPNFETYIPKSAIEICHKGNIFFLNCQVLNQYLQKIFVVCWQICDIIAVSVKWCNSFLAAISDFYYLCKRKSAQLVSFNN